PILSTFIVTLVLLVQMLPLAIAFIAYGAASGTGLISGGVEAMLFWVAAILLSVLSLYWITSILIALVIVTLPGMYPFKSLQAACDMVVSRRFRILLRILWMSLVLLVIWSLVLIPVIIFDGWLKGLWEAIAWVPLVPLTLLALSTLSVIWSSSYIYLFYRKVVADESAKSK